MKTVHIYGIIGASVISVIGSIINSYYANKNAEKSIDAIEEKLQRKVDGLSASLNVDIPDEILENALRRASEEEAKKRIQEISKNVLAEYSSSIRSEVRNSVDIAYANTKTDVKNELSKQISNLDISGIKKEIIAEAGEKAKEKLNDELETIATRFRNDLDSSAKILKVVSDKLGTT